jgi:hypothetical protein
LEGGGEWVGGLKDGIKTGEETSGFVFFISVLLGEIQHRGGGRILARTACI